MFVAGPSFLIWRVDWINSPISRHELIHWQRSAPTNALHFAALIIDHSSFIASNFIKHARNNNYNINNDIHSSIIYSNLLSIYIYM